MTGKHWTAWDSAKFLAAIFLSAGLSSVLGLVVTAWFLGAL